VLARGQTATFVRNEIIKKTIGIACVLVGSLFGIIGLAWGQVVYSVLGFIVNASPAQRDLGYGALRQLVDLATIAAVTLLMAGSVWLVRVAVHASPLVTLAACVLSGAICYAALGWLSRSGAFRDPVVLLRCAFTKSNIR
jgi:hypothetical protein